MMGLLARSESDWCYPRHVRNHHAEPDGIKPLANTRALLFSICPALDKSQRHKCFAPLALDYSHLETGTLVIRNSVTVRGSLHIMPGITEVQRFLGLPSWGLD